MKHFGKADHKAHTQRHFDPAHNAAPWFAWCETHGRIGKPGSKAKTPNPFVATEAEAADRAKAHIFP